MLRLATCALPMCLFAAACEDSRSPRVELDDLDAAVRVDADPDTRRPDPGRDAAPDAGPEAPDAGPEAPDAGPEAPDVGPEAPDAGPEAPDAGPEAPDAGPEAPDAALEPPDAGPDPPDAGPDPGCEVEIVAQGAAPFACRIPDGLDFACGYLARCLCDATQDDPAEIEACATWILIPRGAITLADFCGQRPLTVTELVAAIQPAGLLPEPVRLEASAGCDGIPAVANDQAINWGVEVCREPRIDAPHTVSEARVDGGDLVVQVEARDLCEDAWVHLCWTGSVRGGDAGPAAQIQVLAEPAGAAICPGVARREITTPIWPLRDALVYFDPSEAGPLRLLIRPWKRAAGAECPDSGAAEPCAQAGCEWSGGRCVDPLIEREFELDDAP